MGGERTVFEILRTERDPAADAALLAALEDADWSTASAVVETLLTRNTREALYGLVQTFHLLDETLKQMVLIEWERLFSMLREASQSRSDQVRLNVLEIIRRGCIYRACYLVESALRHRSMDVRMAAADTLSFLAEELLRTAPEAVSNADLQAMDTDQLRERMAELETHAEDRRQVVAAIESAIACYDVHLQPGVVETALWFADEVSPAFWSMLTRPHSKPGQVAIRCINASMGPRLVPFAMIALNLAEFRPHLAKVLAGETDPSFLEEWARHSWRLVQPKIARGASSLHELACAKDRGAELLLLPTAAQRHMARWIACSGLPQADRASLLGDFQRQGCITTRRSALWALTAMVDRKSTELLWSIEDSEDPEAALIARRELARRCPLEMPVSHITGGAGADWDALARSEAESAPMTLERFWSQFDRMSPEQQQAAAAEVARDVPLVKSALARRLNENDPACRIRALRMVDVLGLAGQLEERLYQLCHDPEPHVRSAAMSTIKALKTPAALRILHNALNDSDSRVQANAVESMGASGESSVVDDLLGKLSSSDARVQANAVKALLKLGVREAAETLLRMLRHPSRTHRISALWLVDRMGLFTLASRVAGMADKDPDPSVRQRAAALSEQLPFSKLESTSSRQPARTAKAEVTI